MPKPIQTYPLIQPWLLKFFEKMVPGFLYKMGYLYGSDVDPTQMNEGVPWIFKPPTYEETYGDAANFPQEWKNAIDQAMFGKYGITSIPDEYYEAKDWYRKMAGMSELPEELMRSQPRGTAGPGELETFQRDYLSKMFEYDPETGGLKFSGNMPEEYQKAIDEAATLQKYAEQTPDLSYIGDPEKNPLLKNASEIWEKTVGEKLANQAALSGLGRSTAFLKAQAESRQQALMPFMQQALDIEREKINRGLGAKQSYIDYLLQGAGQKTQREADVYGRMAQLRDIENARAQDQLNAIYEELTNRRNLYGSTLGQRIGALSGAGGGFLDVARDDLNRLFNIVNVSANLGNMFRQQAMEKGTFDYTNWLNNRELFTDLFMNLMSGIPFGSYTQEGQLANTSPWWPYDTRNFPDPGKPGPRGWPKPPEDGQQTSITVTGFNNQTKPWGLTQPIQNRNNNIQPGGFNPQIGINRRRSPLGWLMGF